MPQVAKKKPPEIEPGSGDWQKMGGDKRLKEMISKRKLLSGKADHNRDAVG